MNDRFLTWQRIAILHCTSNAPFLQVSSDGKVPVLQDSSLTLTESAVIVDYVASKYRVEGKTDILPATPLDRAKALLFQDQVIGKVVPSFYAALKATSESEEVQAKTKESWLAAVATLSKALEANGGPFVLGQHMTVPDLLVWPFVQRFVTLKHYRGLEVPSTPEYAAFHRWVSACKARKSVQATGMPDEYFVEGYKFYAYPPK